MYHNPVLKDQCIENLVLNPDGIYVDCTFGGGGHSRAILETLSSKGRLISFDQDSDVLSQKIDDPRFELVLQNFRFVKNNLRFLGIKQVDGILADFGVSSHQFDTPDRGFSTRYDADLDMRMNSQSPLTAKKIIASYSQEELADLFHLYGELTSSKKIAKEIVEAREKTPIKTVEELKALFDYIPEKNKNKFFAQLFQALRIEVNDELSALKEMLIQSEDLIKQGGRLVLLSYHSLEDRLVKRFLKNGSFDQEPEKDFYGNFSTPFKPLSAKVILPSEEEIQENPRARSAKLRIGVRK
ncbi:MAG: 16S rRNA (cytosine(1402)-N(4))-methyltransferase [Flavobacteriaceae bacterium]|nr:MAG: 16S rRNA (cytosine(1402)-N(4))-methyltransferase [Flavobacteriaceae bacterium]